MTTGEWNDPAPLAGLINREVGELKKTKLFSSVELFPVDSDKLKKYYKELKGKTLKEIEFIQHTILPKTKGVRQAYIGILPCTEYLKLITDSEGDLQRSVFNDNVRDFLGDTPVNLEIAATLESASQQELLPILNNGVTIVAKSITQIGSSFRLQEYQIVNGCQTSNVLFKHRKKLGASMSLPIKLIETTDPEITSLIIKATDRQTEVKVEAFAI